MQYKFKDWHIRETSNTIVTDDEKAVRAESIARALNDQERWGSHYRGIDREALAELGLRIDDLEADGELSSLVKEYFWFFRDFAFNISQSSLVHSRSFL